MTRDVSLLAIAVALAGFGIYRALYLPAMLAGPSTPLLFVGFLLQAVAGILAGVGVWRAASWAPLAILAVGASVALTALFELVLGVAAWLVALLHTVVSIALAIAVATYVNVRRRRGLPG